MWPNSRNVKKLKTELQIKSYNPVVCPNYNSHSTWAKGSLAMHEWEKRSLKTKVNVGVQQLQVPLVVDNVRFLGFLVAQVQQCSIHID